MMSVPDPIKTSHLLTLLLEGPILSREKKNILTKAPIIRACLQVNPRVRNKVLYPYDTYRRALQGTTVPKIGTPLMGVIITVDNLVSNEASVRNLKLYDI